MVEANTVRGRLRTRSSADSTVSPPHRRPCGPDAAVSPQIADIDRADRWWATGRIISEIGGLTALTGPARVPGALAGPAGRAGLISENRPSDFGVSPPPLGGESPFIKIQHAPAARRAAQRRLTRECPAVDLARIGWLATVIACLIAVLILVLQGYYGYAGVTLAVAVSAAINLA